MILSEEYSIYLSHEPHKLQLELELNAGRRVGTPLPIWMFLLSRN